MFLKIQKIKYILEYKNDREIKLVENTRVGESNRHLGLGSGPKGDIVLAVLEALWASIFNASNYEFL